MIEVLSENFNELYPRIQESIKNAKFCAIDTEFTALYLSERNKRSLFDTAEDRYTKLRTTANDIIPIQIGLTTYSFEPNNGSYTAQIYTFYIWPRPFRNVNKTLLFKASSFQFLCNHNFDFNKLIYKGLSFLNRTQEQEVQNYLKLQFNFDCDDNEHVLEEVIKEVSPWFYKSKIGDDYTVNVTCKHDLQVFYLLHKHIRHRFQNEIWTYMVNGEFHVKKVSMEEFSRLNTENNLESHTLEQILGFTRVFRLLVEAKKPIIGHNLYMDLLLLYNTFEDDLPKSYKTFKKVLNTMFPSIFDTKTLSFRIMKTIPKNKLWQHNTLAALYEYFNDLQGRHMAFNSPLIKQEVASDLNQFHNAGWDSYCTGYIFIRMAHIFATAPYKKHDRDLTSTEHLAAVDGMKNFINLIRCSISSIKLDGADPKSTRPPCLVIYFKKMLHLSEITSVLGSYGYVEVKSVSKKSAIVAVDNYGNAKRILQRFRSDGDFIAEEYNWWKHSTMSKVLLWSGVLVAGGLLFGRNL